MGELAYFHNTCDLVIWSDPRHSRVRPAAPLDVINTQVRRTAFTPITERNKYVWRCLATAPSIPIWYNSETDANANPHVQPPHIFSPPYPVAKPKGFFLPLFPAPSGQAKGTPFHLIFALPRGFFVSSFRLQIRLDLSVTLVRALNDVSRSNLLTTHV